MAKMTKLGIMNSAADIVKKKYSKDEPEKADKASEEAAETGKKTGKKPPFFAKKAK